MAPKISSFVLLVFSGIILSSSAQRCNFVTLKRDPNDCAQYQECVYANVLLRPCPGGLVFSETMQRCDYQNNVPECRDYRGICTPNPCPASTYCVLAPEDVKGYVCNRGDGPCEPNPCPDDELCVANATDANGYSCVTRSGRYCQSNPCNAGRCIEAANGYTCDCTGTFFTGFKCDRSACDQMTTNPCQNNGVCLPLSTTTYKCDCADGFSGRFCQTAPARRTLRCAEYRCPSDIPRFNYPAWNDTTCQDYYNCEYGVLEYRSCDPGHKFDIISGNCRPENQQFIVTCSDFKQQK